MSIMIPEYVASHSSLGEKRLFAILRDRLENDFLVWHNPVINGSEVDFVILSPNFGLLIIEVKGYYLNNIKKANPDKFEIERREDGIVKIEVEDAPLKQSLQYRNKIINEVKKYPILCQQAGIHRGKAIFPINHAALMSNITRRQISGSKNLCQILHSPQVAFREELLSWELAKSAKIINRLRSFHHWQFDYPPLTTDQISTIKGILFPEYIAKERPANKNSVPINIELPPSSTILETLDLEQERLARSIGEGHRLINGVAGSGKTIILMARAKSLIDRNCNQRVLILCFNITLSGYLRSLLHTDSKNPQYKNIDVLHFHKWAIGFTNRFCEDDEKFGFELAQKLSALDNAQKWDAILVDEAHTFAPSWLACCVLGLKDPENGSLTIVSDGSQSLYDRSKFTWFSLGIKARGRTKKLNKNYRNTQEILTAAWSVVNSIQNKSENTEATFPVVEPIAALQRGVKPILHLSSSPQDEIETAIQYIKALIKFGYNPEDIAVLHSRKNERYWKGIEELIKKLELIGIEHYWVTQSRETKLRFSRIHPGVRIMTAYSSLGLEFKVVMSIWTQQFFCDPKVDLESSIRRRRQLYVAMTRAQERLYLFGSGNSALLDYLKQTKHFKLVVPSDISK